MQFGLKNAAQTFQRYMDGLFRDLDYTYVYIDDILITSDEASHKEKIYAALKRLREALIVDIIRLRLNSWATKLYAKELPPIQ